MTGRLPDETVTFDARTLRLATTIGAAALFAFGVFCLVAANWSDFHRLTKIGLVSGLLLASALAAALFAHARTPALLVTVGAVGGLLALIGQTYPSGADAWQLFAYWAALALPFALATRHDAVWVFWTIVAGAAIGLWRVQESSGVAFADFAPAWGLSVALAIFLSPHSPLRRLLGETRWAFRLASLFAVAMIAQAGLHGLFMSATRGDAALVAALVVLGGAGGALLLVRPIELGVLTMVFGGIDALLIGRALKALAIDRSSPPLAGMILVALLATAIVGGSVALLRSIHARSAGKSAQEAPADGHFSWPLAALSGFGALLAAIPFLALYAIFFEPLLREAGGAAVLGAFTLTAAAVLLRGGAAFGFRQMFGMIAAAVGMALIVYATLRWFHSYAGLALAAVAVVAAWTMTARWARALFGYFALWATVGSIIALVPFSRVETSVALVSIVAALGAAGLAAPSFGAVQAAAARPFLAGWAAAGLITLLMLAGRPFLAGAGSDLVRGFEVLYDRHWAGPAQAVSILLGLSGVVALLARRADLRTPLGLAVAIGAVALTARTPTLGAIIAIFAGAMLAGSRSLAGAAALAAIWSVSGLYYSLAWSLTLKGYALMALGAALGFVAFATRARGVSIGAARGAVGRSALALIALGAVATTGVAGYAVRGSEDVLRNGRRIFIALRPVDPRSLIQGDYMALAFDTAGLPSPAPTRDKLGLHGAHVALVETNDKGVAKFVALDAAPQPDQIPIQIRVKSGRWFVGSDAWFFEEGRASDYAQAKYGVFRVGPDGRALLAAMADGELRILP